jgi:hypothetical protein
VRATHQTSGPRQIPIERVFELARTGRYNNVPEIITRLKAKKFSVDTITEGTHSKQLNDCAGKSKMVGKMAIPL